MANPYVFQRGEDVRLLLAIVGGASEATSVAQVSAVLKPAINGGFVPGDDVAPVATLTVVPNLSPTDGSPPGWYLTLAAAAAAQLMPGIYATNAALTYAGGAVEVTEPVFLAIQPSTAA